MADESNYATAMAILEAGCHQQGIASINFNDGEMVMITLDMLKDLAAKAEQSGQGRVIIFIGRGPIVNEGVKA